MPLALAEDTKRCGGCGRTLPRSEFWKNRAKPDGLQNQCKDCMNLRQQAFRATPEGRAQMQRRNATQQARESRRRYAQTEKGREADKKAHRKHTAKIRRQARQLVRDIKNSTPCADCGQLFHFSAMDFDHVNGDKVDDISQMVWKTYSLETLRKELEKCEVLCAVCHRIRTYERRTGERVDRCQGS